MAVMPWVMLAMQAMAAALVVAARVTILLVKVAAQTTMAKIKPRTRLVRTMCPSWDRLPRMVSA
jgi:hypothetical protein